jgi:biotin transport system permease protein
VTPSLYRPGTSRLHRAPAGLKLAVLAAAGIALVLTGSLPVLAGAALAGLGLVRATGAQLRALRPQVTGLAWVLGIVVAATAVLDGPHQAAAAGLRLLALVLAALAVTLTTQASDLLDALERALAPLERRGWLRADRVGLAVALVLRFVPEIAGQAAALREAQAARGLRANPVTLIVPLIVRTLIRADAVAEAIEARSYPPEKDAAPR